MLRSKDVAPYAPTAEDRLWLSRAVAAEGKPYETVARALVNLFMLQRAGGSGQSLARLVRAYAQPVNPRWYASGDLFLSVGPRTELERNQARAREEVHSTRNTFPPQVKAAVEAALATPFRSDVTDYAVPSLDASKKGYVARGAVVKGENRFWTRKPGWRGYIVDGSSALLPVALVLLAVWARWGRT